MTTFSTDSPESGIELLEQVRAWGRSQDLAAIPRLVDLLKEPDQWFPEDEALRRSATRALAQMGLEQVLALVELADSDNWLVREGLADALGETRDPRAVTLLERFAKDDDERVVMWAALSLSKCGEAGISGLAACLRTAGSFVAEAHLAEALDRMPLRGAQSALEQHLESLSADRRSELEAFLRRRREFRVDHT